MIRSTILGTAFLCIATELTAQVHTSRADVLLVERRQDAAERLGLARALDSVRVSLRLEDADPVALAKQLNAYAGGKTTFFVRSKDGERNWESVTLTLEKRSFLQALSIVTRVSKIRFVFRSGVVLLVHEDDVRPDYYLRIYDLRMATRKVRDFPAPRVGVPVGEGSEPEPEETEGGSVSGFDADRFEEMIRSTILPKSWDDGATLMQSGGIFFIRQSERGHRELASLLRQFGVSVPVVRAVRRAAKPARKPAGTRKGPVK